MEWPSTLKYGAIREWPGAMTRNKVLSPFSASLETTVDGLDRELFHMKAKNAVLQIALPPEGFRIDGAPRANAIPAHSGVILSFDTPDGPLSFPCDKFTRWGDNVRAIVLTMERLRGAARYGVVKHGEQFAAWRAIEATATPAAVFADGTEAMTWLMEYTGYEYEGMPIPDGEEATQSRRRSILRRAQRKAHPDSGGSGADWARVESAERVLRSADMI